MFVSMCDEYIRDVILRTNMNMNIFVGSDMVEYILKIFEYSIKIIKYLNIYKINSSKIYYFTL